MYLWSHFVKDYSTLSVQLIARKILTNALIKQNIDKILHNMLQNVHLVILVFDINLMLFSWL